MNHPTNATAGGRPRRTWARLRPAGPWLRPAGPRAVLTALALLASGLAGVVGTGLVRAPAARADTVPPPPSGWTTVFGDNFAGAAGSAPSAANWFYDIGTGYGTGEKEQTTNSTSNVYLDGNGHLVLKAIDNGGTWTSGRIESTRDDFTAPAGGKLEMTASIEQPNPASGLGYWPAFWALGSPMRTGGGWPQSGEIDMMEDVNGLNEASQTFHNSANSPGHPLIACPGAGSGCQTGYHTYTVIVDRTNTSAETMQFLMDGVVESTITEASVGTAAWQAAVDHGFFIIFDLAMGGNYPDGISGTTTPTSATTSGASMSVGYVAVYEQGGNSTPAATATATGTVTGLSGLCLANQNSLNTSGNPIGVTGCNGSAGQQWSPYSDGTLRTQGGCLDVVSAGTTSGTNVDWYPCNGSAAQDWTHQANGELVNPSSGLCLTVPGANTGARLDIETCTDSAQQQWTTPAGSGGGGGGSGGTCGTTNLALGKTATASSTENAGTPAADAVDGNTGTRWSSAFSDPQWLEVDLGSSQAICQVTLNWETAYAKAFQIQTSTDGTNWTTIYSTTTGTGGTQTLNVTGTGRYVRMYGTARATQYGYSLWEFQVF
jgi:F5/8 type C domain/Ricin-type beta-trefoil lectin domain